MVFDTASKVTHNTDQFGAEDPAGALGEGGGWRRGMKSCLKKNIAEVDFIYFGH